MADWRTRADAAIMRAHVAIPHDATLELRTRMIDEAYPFGTREHWPYKAWLAARKAYLSRYGYRGRGSTAALSSLEQMMSRTGDTP